MKREGLVIGIIFLIIGISIISSTAKDLEKISLPPSRGNWLYVGGSGPGNYTKIQDAIDNASDGDFIFVLAGLYYENILIHKSLHIIGENRDTTIIDGQEIKEAVRINADYVTIEGFTIRNSSHDLPYSSQIGILVESNHTTISNNIILDNSQAAMRLTRASDSTICENAISENGWGIWVLESINNKITSNNINNNSNGILLQHSSKNQIRANTIHHTGAGIYLFDSKRNTIQDNAIFSNNEGIFDESPWNTIQSNTIEFNKITGISLLSCFNVISKNLFKGNAQGIQIEGGFNNKINRNNFLENQISADFRFGVPYRFFIILVRNNWVHNYWDDHHTRLPRLINGTLSYPPDPVTPWDYVTIPWVAVDWFPAKAPFDIPDKN